MRFGLLWLVQPGASEEGVPSTFGRMEMCSCAARATALSTADQSYDPPCVGWIAGQYIPIRSEPTCAFFMRPASPLLERSATTPKKVRGVPALAPGAKQEIPAQAAASDRRQIVRRARTSAAVTHAVTNQTSRVRRVGFEPTSPFGQRLLRPPPLPGLDTAAPLHCDDLC